MFKHVQTSYYEMCFVFNSKNAFPGMHKSLVGLVTGMVSHPPLEHPETE